jgi:transcription elongation factor GreB
MFPSYATPATGARERARARRRTYVVGMSKAFTSEETPESPALVRAPPRLAPGEIRYVTPEGQAALRAELARLRAERDALSGDGSDAARSRGEDLERRAAVAERTLAMLTVLGPEAAPERRAGFGTWVTVEDGEGTRTTWRLVGPDEADARRSLVSVHAPVGRALLGREAGEVVQVERPGGPVELTILEVRRTPPVR